MRHFLLWTALMVGTVFWTGAVHAQASDSLIRQGYKDSSAIVDSLLKTIQNDDLAAVSKRSYLLASLSYLSNNVYLGRKDSVIIPYITPDIAYYFKSGFFLEGAASYVNSAAENRFDVVSFVAGYSFSSGHYSGEATANKFFYSSQSTNVKADLKSSLSYYNSYDFGFITPTLTAALNVGTNTDIAGAVGLEHSFVTLKESLTITPTIVGNGSTQNYYSNYYRKRRYTIKRKGKAPIPGIAHITGIVLNASKFKMLDYELSLPVEYKAGKFTFQITPVYAIPVNAVNILKTTVKQNGVTTTKTLTEQISNTFYWAVGISYKFGKK